MTFAAPNGIVTETCCFVAETPSISSNWPNVNFMSQAVASVKTLFAYTETKSSVCTSLCVGLVMEGVGLSGIDCSFRRRVGCRAKSVSGFEIRLELGKIHHVAY